MLSILALSACADTKEPSTGQSSVSVTSAGNPVEVTRAAKPDSLLPDVNVVHLLVPDGAREGLSLLTVDQAGQGAVQQEIVTLNGGGVEPVTSPSGERAFEFPSYDDEPAAAQRAVLGVTNTGEADVLSPGASDFQFGAEFRIDEQSAGEPTDNGDNLIQRGLFGDGAQYKVDIDKDKPTCRIEGMDGEVLLRASKVVATDTWYAVRCSRRGDEVELVVMEYEGDRLVEHSRDTMTSPTGDLTWEDPALPLSVGGKLTPVGGVVESASDQFNGAVANPFLAIGG